MSPTVKYPGDHTAVYNRDTGAGLVGKVIGGGPRGWFIVTEAYYDPEVDVTYATAEALRRPERLLS